MSTTTRQKRCAQCRTERTSREQDCPEAALHTPCPSGYLQWHSWAEDYAKTHDQHRCPGCGFYKVWVERDAPHPSRAAPPLHQKERDNG